MYRTELLSEVDGKMKFDIAALSCKSLTLREKVLILSERYREQGYSLLDTLGVARVTLSRVANRWCNPSEKLRKDLLDASYGFLQSEDFVTEPLREPEIPAGSVVKKKPTKVAPKKKQPAKAEAIEDGDDFLL